MEAVKEEYGTKINAAWENLRHLNRTKAGDLPTLWCGREISDPSSWNQWAWNLINPLNVTANPRRVIKFLDDNISILIDNNFPEADSKTLGNKRWEIISVSLLKLAGLSSAYSEADTKIYSQFNQMKMRLEQAAQKNTDYRTYIEALRYE
ncbi:MAG: hypothetical protein KR126chlam6_00931 [Candidatus Anoxychlamydiales bacterium]|nr:hypothetical protein [Candidatus Anoxychlamydiales bacterium]